MQQQGRRCNQIKILFKPAYSAGFFYFWNMKKLVIPFTLVAIIVGLYEQSKAKPNIYILCIAIAIFMYGVMKLSAKTPSKNQVEKEEDDVE